MEVSILNILFPTLSVDSPNPFIRMIATFNRDGVPEQELFFIATSHAMIAPDITFLNACQSKGSAELLAAIPETTMSAESEAIAMVLCQRNDLKAEDFLRVFAEAKTWTVQMIVAEALWHQPEFRRQFTQDQIRELQGMTSHDDTIAILDQVLKLN
jgi:hypothetical protein